MELPSFRGYFVQTGQLDWSMQEKKTGTRSLTAEHGSAGSWEICLKQNPLADCHYLATSDDLGAPCTA